MKKHAFLSPGHSIAGHAQRQTAYSLGGMLSIGLTGLILLGGCNKTPAPAPPSAEPATPAQSAHPPPPAPTAPLPQARPALEARPRARLPVQPPLQHWPQLPLLRLRPPLLRRLP